MKDIRCGLIPIQITTEYAWNVIRQRLDLNEDSEGDGIREFSMLRGKIVMNYIGKTMFKKNNIGVVNASESPLQM